MGDIWLHERPYASYQGEGLYMGVPCVFVRTSGCNLSCAFCDTPQKSAGSATVDGVRAAVKELGPANAVITGGEPLLQKTAVMELVDPDLCGHVNWHLETNGTFLLSPEEASKFMHIEVSFKGPSALVDAGVATRHFVEWRELAAGMWPGAIVFKFVCGGEEDIKWIASELATMPSSVICVIQPEDNSGSHPGIVTKQMQNLHAAWAALGPFCSGGNVRFLPRLHRLMFGAKEGV